MTENGSRGARRCLFGREDPERRGQDLAEQVKEEERASAQAFERRWNFNIDSEAPLQGRYQWEKIDNSGSVASTSSSSLSRLPSSPVPEETVNIVVKTVIPESSDTEISSAEDRSTLSSCSTAMGDSDVSEASLSSAEEDLNQNIVRESIKRKATTTLHKEDTREPKRTKPP